MLQRNMDQQHHLPWEAQKSQSSCSLKNSLAALHYSDIYQLQLLSGLLTRNSSLSGLSHLRSECVKKRGKCVLIETGPLDGKEDPRPFEPAVFWCLLMDLWGSNVTEHHVIPACITNVSALHSIVFSCQTLGVVPKLASMGIVRNSILERDILELVLSRGIPLPLMQEVPAW